MELTSVEQNTKDTTNDGEISFKVANIEEPILMLASNGDIYVKGKLVENDKEVVEALREFIKYSSI